MIEIRCLYVDEDKQKIDFWEDMGFLNFSSFWGKYRDGEDPLARLLTEKHEEAQYEESEEGDIDRIESIFIKKTLTSPPSTVFFPSDSSKEKKDFLYLIVVHTSYNYALMDSGDWGKVDSYWKDRVYFIYLSWGGGERSSIVKQRELPQDHFCGLKYKVEDVSEPWFKKRIRKLMDHFRDKAKEIKNDDDLKTFKPDWSILDREEVRLSLGCFEAFDFLVQGYLSRDEKNFTEEELLSGFNESKEELEKAFTVEFDQELKKYLERYCPSVEPWFARSLNSKSSLKAAEKWFKSSGDDNKKEEQGALRLLVEIVRNKDTEFLKKIEWSDKFNNTEKIIKIMRAAHSEFSRVCGDVKACR